MGKPALFLVKVELEGVYYSEDGKRPDGTAALEVISEEYHNTYSSDLEIVKMHKNSAVPATDSGDTLVHGNHDGDLTLDEAYERAGIDD